MAHQSFSPSLGARTLQEEEIRLSLPTYEKLKQQIETIRESAIAYQTSKDRKADSENAFTRPQVTNNLSVLGCRGSGKSSVLKTLYRDLESRNEPDNPINILLPPIVPENLESHMTMMSSLLGLLNNLVTQISDKQKQTSPCPVCPPEKNPLEKEYRELVEYYVHLQKPYQDISIQKYSTESEYVRTMSKVFEAGNQFSLKLWNFIDRLLEDRREGALLFVFIDDIDLSTYRCSDVVRTLLGYISHPCVVTVLAGDIEVFGEALTLDFLRQEEMLGKGGIQFNYTVTQAQPGDERKKLLNRKKDLAYEYLKKVMPPMNRHSISVWTLYNRGKFCPVGLYRGGAEPAGESVPSLQALLARTNGFNRLLRSYFSVPGEGDGLGPEPCDYVLYHLFDSTARGLLNCYIPIEQMEAQWASGENRFENIKFALESIVFSNPALNNLRDLIFSSFLQFGSDMDSTNLFFDHFIQWAEEQVPYLAGNNRYQERQTLGVLSLFDPETLVFQVFVYLDWAARLLGRDVTQQNWNYEIAKREALLLLCAGGAISGNNADLSTAAQTTLYNLAFRPLRPLASSASAAEVALRCFFGLPFPLAIRYFRTFHVSRMLSNISDYTNNGEAETALDKLQRAVDFIDVVNRFYGDDLAEASTCLSEQPEMLEFIERQMKSSRDALLTAIICNTYFKNGEGSSFDFRNRKLSPLYRIYCKNGLSISCTQTEDQYKMNTISRIEISCLDRVLGAGKQDGLNSYLGEAPNVAFSGSAKAAMVNFIPEIRNKKSTEYALALRNGSAEMLCAYSWKELLEENGDSSAAAPIYNFYSERIWKSISDHNCHLQPLRDRYADIAALAKSLCDPEEGREQPSLMERRLAILFAIDSKALWVQEAFNSEDESPIGQIKTYILKQLIICENRLVSASDIAGAEDYGPEGIRVPLIDGPKVPDAFQQLKEANTGGRNTLAKRCIRFLEPLISSAPVRMTAMEYIYARCVLDRLIHSRAWYGKAEARKVLSALDQASLGISPERMDPAAWERYVFWFHCYCRCRMAELSDETYALIDKIYDAWTLIEEAGRRFDQREWNRFNQVMRAEGELTEELIQQIPKLFE